jgi:lipid-A-disaccharide synthase
MKFFVMAGEVSGDQHAASLVRAIKKQAPSAQFDFCGGLALESEIQKPSLIPLERLSIMGIFKVIQHWKTVRNNFREVKKHLQSNAFDALILVDYPGFNLRIAQWAKKRGMKVFFYISPTVWAWKESRIKIIQSSVDQLYCILPFEQLFYRERGVEVSYFGNPTASEWRTSEMSERLNQIALFPGSRKQEIQSLAPVYRMLMDQFPSEKFILSCAPGIDEKWLLEQFNHTECSISHHSKSLLKESKAAVLCSGTVSLEAGLANCPQVLVYRLDRFSWFLAKLLVKLNYISLVNLVLGKMEVEERVGPYWGVDELSESLNRTLEKRLGIATREKLLAAFGDLEPEPQIAADILKRINT